MIQLRPLELEDSELIRNWRFSEDAYNYFYEWQPQSKANNQAWVQSMLNKKDEINFIIRQKKSNQDIGMISLLHIDYRNRHCELGRVLIADEKSRALGIGKRVITLLFEYAFHHLNLRKIYCEVLEDNVRAYNFYKKCGFEKDGLFKNHIFKNGEYKNVVHMSYEK